MHDRSANCPQGPRSHSFGLSSGPRVGRFRIGSVRGRSVPTLFRRGPGMRQAARSQPQPEAGARTQMLALTHADRDTRPAGALPVLHVSPPCPRCLAFAPTIYGIVLGGRPPGISCRRLDVGARTINSHPGLMKRLGVSSGSKSRLSDSALSNLRRVTTHRSSPLSERQRRRPARTCRDTHWQMMTQYATGNERLCRWIGRCSRT